jgi:hypothetical protein
MMFLWQNFDLPIFVRQKEAKHFLLTLHNPDLLSGAG